MSENELGSEQIGDSVFVVIRTCPSLSLNTNLIDSRRIYHKDVSVMID